MKLKITKDIAKKMIRGSSIYSTGGGIEYSVQKKLFTKLFSQRKFLDLVSLDTLSDNDFICTAYSVGSAGNTDVDLAPALRIGLSTLETYTQKKFKAIFAGETNIDILAFQAASKMNFPVLDADATGGRAVPTIEIDNFSVKGRNTLPLVAVTPNLEVIILSKVNSITSVEPFIRGLLSQSSTGLVTVLDHAVSAKEAKELLTVGIFERAITLGNLIEENKRDNTIVKKIITHLNGKLLLEGTVTKVEKKEGSDFLEGQYYVTNKKDALKVYFKNENLIAWMNDKVILTCPDSIITLDTDTLLGVHNSTLKVGKKVAVIGMKATSLWRTKKGIELFSPDQFGFEIRTKLL